MQTLEGCASALVKLPNADEAKPEEAKESDPLGESPWAPGTRRAPTVSFVLAWELLRHDESRRGHWAEVPRAPGRAMAVCYTKYGHLQPYPAV